MNSRGLGIEGLKVTGTSAQAATFAIDAISDVSWRGRYSFIRLSQVRGGQADDTLQPN